MTPRKVAILGSTGSIGTQALDVIARYPERFTVVALAAGRNVELLREQTLRFQPAIVTTGADGPAGLHRVAAESDAEIVLAATDGAVAFDAVFAAIERGIDVAVANKELIVAAGELLMERAARSGSQILPVDSEHSAIFQCLVGEDPSSVAAIVLTASGGPFWRCDAEKIANATVDQALAHPTWQMGTKNTIDSATMMNKGLEIIEASRLFRTPPERLHILVHPQSIAHGLVYFKDGSIKSQLCPPDMRVPIGYALAFPERLGVSPVLRQAQDDRQPQDDGGEDPLTLLGGNAQAVQLNLQFERPDSERFPCVALAYEVLERGGVAPTVLSAANEVAVKAFVERKIRFGGIAEIIKQAVDMVPQRSATLDGIREADHEARIVADRTIHTLR
jgi:1-deoxy-D-xylulose-5-phosphate reductoisomerase